MSSEAQNVRISVQMQEKPVIVGTFDDKELGFVVTEATTAASLIASVNQLVMCLSQSDAK